MSLKKIFILDDEAEMLELLQIMLGRQYNILSRSNTDEFEKDIKEFKPDVIIIDHFMGDSRSQDIISTHAKELGNIPVILHSAHEEIEKIARISQASAYIKKPSGIREIRAKIETVIRGSGS